ncbi:hypothetical protein [Pseudoroseomonas cervicalis]|uniref:hypothetical protein n=1 Tax=Teichococcus cervicalis TaxID=204525 RepID=UPI0027827700|nr:hypothetical protein [Pseudoroseomonas cervicalis]MDQ1081883.1 hypothetical protein [Pseudoroseomonas cervicalis]
MPFWLNRDKANLWTLLAPPTIWALHFLLCYGYAAIACAKAPDIFVNQPTTRLVIGVATLLALLLILLAGRQAHRHWGGFDAADPPHDAPTEADRQRFLGFATLLLASLSAVAVLFTALPALTVADCR